MEFLPAGIDVSKLWFDVVVLVAGKPYHSRFDNDGNGFEAFGTWLKSFPQPARICLEATGVYHRELVSWLWEAGIEVQVLNAYRAKQLSKGMGFQGKDDRTDAQALAQIAGLGGFKRSEPVRNEQMEALREVTAHSTTQVRDRQAKNPLEGAPSQLAYG